MPAGTNSSSGKSIMGQLMKNVKSVLPKQVLWRLSKARTVLGRMRNRVRRLHDVFDDVYRNNRWGGSAGEMYSGSGSRGHAAEIYIQVVADFIKANRVSGIVDVGCGDFYIAGRILELAGPATSYVGLDAAKTVVEVNRQKFAKQGVKFVWCDAATDELPAGDLCLVRQVLQHLSNSQILAILKKLGQFRWVIITEHYPASFRFKKFNTDKPHGSDTRLIDGSAVYLDHPPFDLYRITLLAEIDVYRGDPLLEGQIKSWLIEQDQSAGAGR
jgi:SAM-dependent methyltransferase